MTIRFRNILGAAALVAGSALVTTQVVSQQVQEQPNEEMQAMMEAWMKLAQPGEAHAKLAKWKGKWSQRHTHVTHAGAEPDVSTSTSVMKPILGGHFMLENVNGSFNINGEDVPFEGMGIYGYDNFKQKHFFAWIDNFGTMMMVGEGTADETGDVITYYSELPNPQSGGMMKVKSVSTVKDDDTHMFEMYEKQPDGSWFRKMEMVATRKE